MALIEENNQPQQEEQKKGPGTIDVINNLASGLYKRPGAGSKAVATAAQTTLKAASGFFAGISSGTWIALGLIALLFIIVLLIVMSGVAPGAPPQTTPHPAL